MRALPASYPRNGNVWQASTPNLRIRAAVSIGEECGARGCTKKQPRALFTLLSVCLLAKKLRLFRGEFFFSDYSFIEQLLVFDDFVGN